MIVASIIEVYNLIMKFFFTNSLKKILKLFNYELKKISNITLFPPEFDDKDKQIFKYIKNNNLYIMNKNIFTNIVNLILLHIPYNYGL